MLTLRCITKTRAFLSPIPTSFLLLTTTTPFFSNSLATAATAPSTPTTTTTIRSSDELQLQAKVVVLSFKDWFKSGNNSLLDLIFDILRRGGPESGSSDLALTQLGLRLSEPFVLDVLNYGKSRKDVLSCLKFFDWAGRQPGPFHHTRATFIAIFKILSKAKLMSLMLDFLDTYTKQRFSHKVRFYSTLVMGYAVAGKPEVALQLFGKMRFQGIDLDGFAYHVLLNALVEERYFDAVEVVAKQISLRGFDSEVTHSILVKNFCKQNQLDKAESVIRGLVSEGWGLSGHVVGTLVDALCKRNQFEKAGELLDEFRGLGMVCAEDAYGVWIRDLVQAGRIDGALEFFKREKTLEGYVPDLFRYNVLICRLLRENRLEDVCELLMEMNERRVLPDEVTMNAALCFFCKAGMVEVALELYNSRNEFGLSPSSMAYNYLINTLCGDGSIDEAYHVLKDSVDQGYFPGKKTFSILADALCREGKFDKMKELVVVALGRNMMPSDSVYDKFISALCKAGRVEDGYLVHGALNRSNKVASRNTYFNLIYGFNKSNRGDIAARLLLEMQEKGHSPTRKLYRVVIRCVCDMENPEKQFLKLLEMQLSRYEPSCQVYNFFIDGAGHARKPELARLVYEMMARSGIEPNLGSDILMLQSYLKSEKISDALNFYRDLSQRRRIGKKLCNTIIVGLCKANKPDLALEMLGEIRENKLKPSLECYEELVKVLCSNNRYSVVVNLLDDLIKVGRPISSFIGNVLLLHSLKSQELYWDWVRTRDVQNETSSSWLLSQLICSFSSHKMNQDVKDLEKLVEQCFPLDIYTYNMLLRRLSMVHMDHAIELFNRLCQKGYEPDRWTYDTLAHGFLKHGRTVEAKRWVEEMFRKGLDPTERTKQLM
ncbi:pentatricopeptide repeat-containing protein At1g71210, mitochondrial [Rhododendron vialii]|uniref:pentatricopeptide repeat-containing protein At1g71210, mitochondrial n=1 Tax=Rhododendron vialii TaxID=182163 RepID=UPI00265F7CE7|nr:pentatricopeptide repeat-containing protein At1g71210, mitochondrial [Rhododendron vialii]XP_058207820.1 pentatricopeptide repeat-containing protein At1g71210, mitochondrial [Rhododendron vialii]XP_058207829.1 pentatricopeptide repeat-containing protein At1g71210, mitochondrial [Rhododendron vialii]